MKLIRPLKSLAAKVAVLSLAVLAFPAKTVAALPTPAAHVYLVYQGKNTITGFDKSVSTGTTSATGTIYLIVDMANPYSYSVMSVGGGSYDIDSRVLSADGTSMTGYNNGSADTSANPAQNFIAGASTGSTTPKGYAAFLYSREGTTTVNSGTYTKTTIVYATGALVGLSKTAAVTIVAKNALIAASGVYKINPVPAAITNYIGTPGNASLSAYPTSLSGPSIKYEVSPTVVATGASLPPVTFLSTAGTFSVTLNTTLTALANVGGTYKLTGQTSATTIHPVSAQLNSSSSPTVYEDFLFQIAKSLGLATNYTPNP